VAPKGKSLARNDKAPTLTLLPVAAGLALFSGSADMGGHNGGSTGIAAVFPLFLATGMALALALFSPRDAHASLIELTSRPAGDTVYWNTLSPTPSSGYITPQPFTSPGGVTGTVNFNSPGALVANCCLGDLGNFSGNFARGDWVIETTGAGAPLAINFNSPVQAVGAQIQDNNAVADHFTAQILAFSGSTFLGSFTENGVGGQAADNSDPFLGVQDSTADITTIIFQIFITTQPPPQQGNVAINQMTIDAPATTPVPATLPLFAGGLGALGLLGWRRKRKAHAVA
jgi:hypothetical protein